MPYTQTAQKTHAQIIGVDKLSGCKDPDKQFLLLIDHIKRIRDGIFWQGSHITIFVEHNLGFESEHHERALRGLPNVSFYRDEKRQRVGILTTLQVKHAACTLVNSMLRENRLSVLPDDEIVSVEPTSNKKLLQEEMKIYSYQFKSAATVFNKDQCALSGKVGGMCDDLAILLQLAIYWTNHLMTSGTYE